MKTFLYFIAAVLFFIFAHAALAGEVIHTYKSTTPISKTVIDVEALYKTEIGFCRRLSDDLRRVFVEGLNGDRVLLSVKSEGQWFEVSRDEIFVVPMILREYDIEKASYASGFCPVLFEITYKGVDDDGAHFDIVIRKQG